MRRKVSSSFNKFDWKTKKIDWKGKILKMLWHSLSKLEKYNSIVSKMLTLLSILRIGVGSEWMSMRNRKDGRKRMPGWKITYRWMQITVNPINPFLFSFVRRQLTGMENGFTLSVTNRWFSVRRIVTLSTRHHAFTFSFYLPIYYHSNPFNFIKY